MNENVTLKDIQIQWHGTWRSYFLGFIVSILLSIISFLLVITKALPEKYLNYAIIALALIQAIFQLKLFLHLGKEAKPYWETACFYFMISILLIIATGSLWIMDDLNERVMSEQNMKILMETSHD